MTPDDFTYVGAELHLFAEARHWKAYLAAQVRPFLGRTVLEVGAGLGATTRALCRAPHDRWVCLEPDAHLASMIEDSRAASKLPTCCEVVVGTLETARLDRFDTILYIDVLEHIEHDRAELVRASHHLRPGGHLVVLSPAHPWLFSAFDRAIGHHRRYTAATLRAIAPAGLTLVCLRYLDSVGAASSAANRLLNQQLPTAGQIRLWDTVMIPLSRCLDVLTAYQLGRTLLAVWRLAELTETADRRRHVLVRPD